MERGVLEIITCAATHGFLPLMENFRRQRADFIARDRHRKRLAGSANVAASALMSRPGDILAGKHSADSSSMRTD
jgi:hypothetical protein